MDNRKICCIFNLAPHYRSAIFKLMDIELNCDFYFGDKVDTSIKILDVNELAGYKKTVENIKIFDNRFRWQKGVICLVFKPYKYFILTGDHSILSNWIIAFLARLLNKKVFIWMHGLKSCSPLSKREKVLIYPFYHLSNAFLLYGNYSRNIMIKKGFKPGKMKCIYNSLDYNEQILIRKNLQKTNIYSDYFNNDLPVLIYIGRIQKVKKIDMILVAMLILNQRGIKSNLAIVGENSSELSFSKQIADSRMESFIWNYGPCYNEEVLGELIYNANVCVSPGNVGLTAIHCFTYGTPVITNNNFETQGPEFEVIEPGINGDFFEEDNVWDLADKISKWISLDSAKRERARLSAYKIIDEKYNPQYQIEVLKEVINKYK